MNRSHGLRRHPLYVSWCNMKSRCYNPNNEKYQRYGGRGVKVCKEWIHDFQAFYNWAMANDWQEGMQVDKDIKGDNLLYSPETCSIVSLKTNCNHRSFCVFLEIDGVIKNFNQWCEHYGINHRTARSRVRTGWSLVEAVSTPLIRTR